MARHTITYEEMSDYLNQEGWHNAASSGGFESNKRLEVSTKGTFRVTTHGKITYQGASLGVAVDAYNEAP
jgi:hypothetical protein